MSYDFIKANKENSFYPVTESEIEEVGQILNLKIPHECKRFSVENE